MNCFISHKIEGQKLYLNAEESFHCAKVLRMKTGDVIRVIDGTGNGWIAELSVIHEKECVALIREKIISAEKKCGLHIAVAPTKNMDRIEWFAEKATELGVREISFIICRNSERKIIKEERIRKICESAAKQSLQSFIPKVNAAVDYNKFISAHKDAEAVKCIAHCEPGQKNDISNFLQENAIVLIGPEGDFSPDEIQQALQNNYMPVSLGESRLRTETAAMYLSAVYRQKFPSGK